MTPRNGRIGTTFAGQQISLSQLRKIVKANQSQNLSNEDQTLNKTCHGLDEHQKRCACNSLWLIVKYAPLLNATNAEFRLPLQSRKKYQASIEQLRQLHSQTQDFAMHPYIAVPATLALVYRAYSRNSLTPLGIVVAALTAAVHAIHPWSLPFALLVVFFLAGTAVTKVSLVPFPLPCAPNHSCIHLPFNTTFQQ